MAGGRPKSNTFLSEKEKNLVSEAEPRWVGRWILEFILQKNNSFYDDFLKGGR